MTVIGKVAWIRLEAGRILSTRSRGKDVYYVPGGKPEPGEADTETLVREIHEELSVVIAPSTVAYIGTFEGPAHGQLSGAVVRMSCYAADYKGNLAPSSEIAEFDWLTYADRDRVSLTDRLILGYLHGTGQLT